MRILKLAYRRWVFAEEKFVRALRVWFGPRLHLFGLPLLITSTFPTVKTLKNVLILSNKPQRIHRGISHHVNNAKFFLHVGRHSTRHPTQLRVHISRHNSLLRLQHTAAKAQHLWSSIATFTKHEWNPGFLDPKIPGKPNPQIQSSNGTMNTFQRST